MNISIENTLSGESFFIFVEHDDTVGDVRSKISEEADLVNPIFDLYGEGSLIPTRGLAHSRKPFLTHVFVTADSVFEIRRREYTDELKIISKVIGPLDMDRAITSEYMLKSEDVCAKVVSQCPSFLYSPKLRHMRTSVAVIAAAVSKNGILLKAASRDLRDTREIVLKAVSNRGIALEFASPRLQSDADVVMKAVTVEGDALRFSRCEQSAEMAGIAVEKSWRALEYVHESLLTKELVLSAVAANGMALEFAKCYRNDAEVVLTAVRTDGGAIEHAVFQNDEICREACRRYARALRWITTTDRDLQKLAVTHYGMSYYYIMSLGHDIELLTAAVKNIAKAIGYATPEMLKSPELLEIAAAGNVGVWGYLPEDVPLARDDNFIASQIRRKDYTRAHHGYYLGRFLSITKEIAMALADIGQPIVPPEKLLRSDEELRKYLVENGLDLKEIPRDLRTRELVMLAVTKKGSNLKEARDFWSDREIVFAAKSDPSSIQFADPSITSDESFVKDFINNCIVTERNDKGEIDPYTKSPKPIKKLGNGKVLKYLSAEHQANRSIVILAVQLHGKYLKYASKELRADHEVVRTAILSYPMALAFASEDLRNNFDVVLSAVSSNGLALEFASPSLQDNIDIVSPAVANTGLALKHAGPSMKDNPQIIIRAVSNTWKAFAFASNYMRENWEGNPVFEAAKELPDPRSTFTIQPPPSKYSSWVNCVIQKQTEDEDREQQNAW